MATGGQFQFGLTNVVLNKLFGSIFSKRSRCSSKDGGASKRSSSRFDDRIFEDGFFDTRKKRTAGSKTKKETTMQVPGEEGRTMSLKQCVAAERHVLNEMKKARDITTTRSEKEQSSDEEINVHIDFSTAVPVDLYWSLVVAGERARSRGQHEPLIAKTRSNDSDLSSRLACSGRPSRRPKFTLKLAKSGDWSELAEVVV